MFDKYSPGNYLAFWIIKNLLESSGHPAFFIFGPGEFEYKKRFLAKALPVYRYERITPANIHGLVRMINRWRKERYKRWKKQKSSVRSA
jgi:CelD/BcsL family acetyltransferase involved in cellulose biosynthesis